MLKWFKEQSSSVKGMIILGLLLVVGIIFRWGYIKKELSLTFGNMFAKPATEQVEAAE